MDHASQLELLVVVVVVVVVVYACTPAALFLSAQDVLLVFQPVTVAESLPCCIRPSPSKRITGQRRRPQVHCNMLFRRRAWTYYGTVYSGRIDEKQQ